MVAWLKGGYISKLYRGVLYRGVLYRGVLYSYASLDRVELCRHTWRLLDRGQLGSRPRTPTLLA